MSRTDEFRKAHRPGDHVLGRVLTRPEAGLAWIDFHGLPLLARVQTPVLFGQQVLFLITSLHPEVVLKQIPPGSPENGAVDLTLLVGDLLRLRARLDTVVSERLADKLLSEQDLVRRRLIFRRFLHQNGEGLILSRIREISLLINTVLAREGQRRYLYLPWLLPVARESSMVATPLHPGTKPLFGAGAGEYAFRARMGELMVAAELRVRPGLAACRIFCDDRHMAAKLCRWVQEWHFGALPLQISELDTLPFGACSVPDPLQLLLKDRKVRVNLRI